MSPRWTLVLGVLGLCSCTGKASTQTGDAAANRTTETPDAGSSPTITPDAGPPDAGPVGPSAPIKVGDWTYYGTGQGLSTDIQDVSADEGGNVYVAGGNALYVKTRTDEQFLRFDAENGGLSKKCFPDIYSQCGIAGYPSCADQTNPPDSSYFLCKVLAVAGAAPGKAIVGYWGYGDDVQNYTEAGSMAGGADVVAFDPDKRVLTKTRHAWIVSPPHTVCTAPSAYEERAPPGFVCPTQDSWWLGGRRLFRRVHRIAVNHDTSSPKYGDAWFCGEHATFAALLNNGVEQRNMYDRTAAFPYFADAYDTWEHLHPALHDATNSFINAACWGLSIAPDGTPWASNQYRTAWVGYPGSDLSNDNFGMSPYVTPTTCPAGSTCAPYAGYDIWPDPPDAASFSSEYYGSVFDGVLSLSHCPDGTLWVGSFMHGLARIDTSGGITNDFGHSDPILRNPIQTVACDPLDSSVWIGFQNGQLGRFRNGAVELVDTTGAPDFAKNVVQSIQIDRWATNSRRIVYFAFGPNTDAIGNITAGGGVAAYAGP